MSVDEYYSNLGVKHSSMGCTICDDIKRSFHIFTIGRYSRRLKRKYKI